MFRPAGLAALDAGARSFVESAAGSGADACPFTRAPVDEIVPAFLARAGMVGDLVGGQPRLPGQGERDVPHVGPFILGREIELATGRQSGKTRAGLDGELIEREVIGSERATLRRVRPASLRMSVPSCRT